MVHIKVELDFIPVHERLPKNNGSQWLVVKGRTCSGRMTTIPGIFYQGSFYEARVVLFGEPVVQSLQMHDVEYWAEIVDTSKESDEKEPMIQPD